MKHLEGRTLCAGLACCIALSACGDDESPSEGTMTAHDASTSKSDAEVQRDASSDVDASVSADAEVSPEDAGQARDDAGEADDAARPALEELPYARGVVSFTPGEYAGFGNAKLPDVVLGPPKGNGTGSGSFDVLSLGVGGEIVLSFGDKTIVDAEGPDFMVFENAFWPSGDSSKPFAEPAQVSVSDDGANWVAFPCATTPTTGEAPYPGCAGVKPTLKYDAFTLLPLDPTLTGGDAFDLAALGLDRARFVRIVDQGTSGEGTTAGFDLDAVGIIHVGP
jgi:hypothetical protein